MAWYWITLLVSAWAFGLVWTARVLFINEMKRNEERGYRNPKTEIDGEDRLMIFGASIFWFMWTPFCGLAYLANRYIFGPLETPRMKAARIEEARRNRKEIIAKLERSELPDVVDQ